MACLGTGKILVSPGGRAATAKPQVWSLNGGDGLVLRGQAAGCRFLASVHYRIVPTDPEKYDVLEGRWRVTTSADLYEFRAPDNAKLRAMPQNAQWRTVLAESEGIHQLYRSGSEDPSPPAGGR